MKYIYIIFFPCCIFKNKSNFLPVDFRKIGVIGVFCAETSGCADFEIVILDGDFVFKIAVIGKTNLKTKKYIHIKVTLCKIDKNMGC